MSSMMESLKVIAKRWNRVKLLAALVRGIVYCSLLPFIFLLISRFVPIMYSKWIAAVIWLAGIVVIQVVIWLKRMKPVGAAKLVDVELGEDAVLTALSLEAQHEATYMGQLVMEQAMRTTKQYEQELPQRIPWKRGWNTTKWMYLMALTILVVGTLLVLPNEQDIIAKQVKRQEIVKEEMTEKLEELKEEIEQSQLAEEDKEQLLTPLEELLQKLGDQQQLEAHNGAELEEALDQLQQLHEQKQEQAKQLEALKEQMEKHKSLDQLQQAMDEAMKQEGEQQQQALREALQQLTEEQKEALEQLAKQLSAQQAELASLLEEAAEQLATGELNEQTAEQLASELAQLLASNEASSMLSQMVADLASQLADISASLSELDPALSQSLAAALQQYEASKQSAAGSGSEQGSSDGQDQGSGTGEGSGDGQGQGSGTGQGQGSGAGQGSGTGQGQGSGAGAGGGQGGSGAGTSPGSHATITTPRLEGESEISIDGGPSSGGQIISGGISPILDGQQGDYSEVFRQYEAEAKDSLNRSTLPSHVQSKVQQYFDSIQPD